MDKRSKGSKYPSPDDGVLVSPINWQVIDESGEPAEDSGENSEHSGEPSEVPGTGTGEQGNRGTGEGGYGSSNQLGYPQAVDNSPPEFFSTPAANASRVACPRHINTPPDKIPPCRACQTLRLESEQSAALAEETEKARRRALIDSCPDCDSNGLAYEVGTNVARRCNHNNPKIAPSAPAAPSTAALGLPAPEQPNKPLKRPASNDEPPF
ncbi:hypothetical protein F4V58_06690 [Corynebacterium phocae]|uniref:hypothetical protein n=1 Tax=Corynebacterium phocae TaxID=161895 RepID=UPI001288BDE7|nr:hypothetical protein [Corynebacterium phocae]KAA8723014.1 hypothetical protein F4V58_06690 [Corynebacterium phocae]